MKSVNYFHFFLGSESNISLRLAYDLLRFKICFSNVSELFSVSLYGFVTASINLLVLNTEL
jgi:hypothetical protein